MFEAIGMQFVLRTATNEDYKALCMLYTQLDRVHYQALPEFFRPVGVLLTLFMKNWVIVQRGDV